MALNGKNIIFVAGLGGIGLETCKELLSRDLSNLVILDRTPNLQAIAELKLLNPKAYVSFVPYDVTVSIEQQREVMKKIFDQLRVVHILINGAGILDEHLIERTIAVNFAGLVSTTTAIMDFWDKRKGGSGGIVCNIGSVTGFNSINQIPVYSATKAGVVSFTNSLARLAPITGVTAYSINPGITKTPLVSTINSWLDVEPRIGELFNTVCPTQSVQICAQNFVKAIEANKNGAIWMLDVGKLEEIAWTTYWDSGI